MSPRGGSPTGRALVGPSVSQRERRGAGPVTTKGQERRNAILAAARRVFEERGYVETRVADIVQEAKVAQGTFYTYFDSKEAVFAELAKDITESMERALHADRTSARPRTPLERVHSGLVRFVEAFRPNAVMLGLIEQVGTFTPEMREFRLALREAFVDRSAQGIRRMQEEGEANASIDPLITAEILGSMVDATCFVWFTLGKDFEEDQVLQNLTLIWARAIGLSEESLVRFS